MAIEPGPARLFVALWPSPPVRQALAAQQARWTWPAGAALTPADQLHLTLHFIGAVAADRVPAVVAGIALPGSRFTLVLDAPEVWPNHCAVLGASTLPHALGELHAALAEALRRLQSPVETRNFRPHVTLARKATGAMAPATPTPVRWPVHGFTLVHSARGRYTPIAHYP